MTTPAGWYPDVHAPGTERFWDGATWTAATRPVAVSASTTVTARTRPGAPYIAALAVGCMCAAALIALSFTDWYGVVFISGYGNGLEFVEGKVAIGAGAAVLVLLVVAAIVRASGGRRTLLGLALVGALAGLAGPSSVFVRLLRDPEDVVIIAAGLPATVVAAFGLVIATVIGLATSRR